MPLSRFIFRARLAIPATAVLCLGAMGLPLSGQQPSAPAQATPAARPQTSAAPRTQGQSPASPQGLEPTLPQAQPDLSLDHDPILSPDPEDNMAINPAAPVPNERAGALKKGQNGVYTLHEDVDEFFLNSTVINKKEKPVMDLKQS